MSDSSTSTTTPAADALAGAPVGPVAPVGPGYVDRRARLHLWAQRVGYRRIAGHGAGLGPGDGGVVGRRVPVSMVGPGPVLGLMIGAYVALFGTLTWLQQSHFATFGFDMGIFDQEIWLASRFTRTFITVRGLDMWANHANPIVYLLLPAYWLGAGPHFLYLLQTVSLACGAVPLWLMARRALGDGWLALTVPLAWLLYPSIEWMTWWHFHPEALAITPFLFAWWFASRGSWRWYAVCVVVVLATKEDAAVAVAALGLVVAWRVDRRRGAVTVVGAVAWMVLCLKVLIPHATGATSPFYANQYSDLGSSLNSVVYNAVRHPSRVIDLALRHDRHDYYVKLLAPVGAVCLLGPGMLLIALPTVLENVLNNQGYPHDFRFQYQVFVCCGVFLAVVEGMARPRRAAFRRFLAGAVCATSLAAAAVWGPSPLNARVFHSGVWALHRTNHDVAMDRAVHLVPAGASVTASYPIVPHLTHRRLIYEWPNPFVRSYYGIDASNSPLPDPSSIDYLVLDTGLNPAQDKLVADLTAPAGPYAVVFKRDGVMVAKKVAPGPATGRD